MPREYVYLLTLDDSQVITTISKIDSALESLGKRAGNSLRNGSGIGKSLTSEAQEVDRAAQDITRSFDNIARQGIESSQKLVKERQNSKLQLANLQSALANELKKSVSEESTAVRKSLKEQIQQVKAVIAAQSQRIDVAKEVAQSEAKAAADQKRADTDRKKAVAEQLREERRVESERKKGLAEQRQVAARTAAFETRLNRQRVAESREAVSEFSRLTQSFPEQAQQIDALAQTYGNFTAVLGRTGDEANALDRAFNDVIAGNKELSDKAKDITDRFGEVEVGVRKLQGTSTKGGGVFSSLFASFKSAGSALAISALLQINRIIGDIIRSVIRMTSEFLKSSIGTASQFENVSRSLESVFGSIEVGSAVFRKIRQDSIELGADLTLTARRVLPFVSSLEEARKVALLITDLARLDPEQGTEGALRSVNDALVGQFRSLRESFEIPVTGLGELQDELGNVEGLVAGVRENLDAVGVSLDALGGTFDVTQTKVSEIFRDLKAELGTPIVDVLNESFKELIQFFDDNEDGVRTFFRLIGQGISDIIGGGLDLGEKFLENIDFDSLNLALSKNIFLIEKLVETIEGADFSKLTTLFETLVKYQDIVVSSVFAATKITEALGGAIGDLVKTPTDIDISGSLLGLGQAITEIREFNAELGGATNSILEQASAMNEATEAELNMADAILATRRAIKDRDELVLDFNDATKEANEERLALEKELAEEILQQERQLANSLNELQIDSSQKRRDAIKDALKDALDAIKKYRRDVLDSDKKFSRDEEDALLKNARSLEDLEKKVAQKKLDLEEDFRRKLRDIRQKFDDDALEAILANDAVRLREIRRRQQNEERNAEQDRKDALADAEKDTSDGRSNIATQLQRDLDDAQIELSRRGEDLNTALERQGDDIQQALVEEFAAIKQSEKDKTAELNRQHEFRLNESKLQNDRELAILQEGLDAQYEAILAQNIRVNTALIAQQKARIALLNEQKTSIGGGVGDKLGFANPASDSGSSRADRARQIANGVLGSLLSKGLTGFREFGGPVLSGQSFVVGENGPELVRFPASAIIDPNLNNLRLSPSSTASTRIDNSRNISAEIGLGRLTGLSPIERAEVLNIVSEFLQRAIS